MNKVQRNLSNHGAEKGLMSKSAVARDDIGAVFVFFVGVLSVVLLLVGLAIDVGNLHRAQIALQKSADVSAISGLGYTTRRGKFAMESELRAGGASWSSNDEKDLRYTEFLVPKAREIVYSTMGRDGLPHLPGSDFEIETTGTYESFDPQLNADISASFSVVARRQVNLLLLDLISGFGVGPTRTLEATATAERKVANIVLLLDVSDSMECPASGSCACNMSGNPTPCPRPQKIDALIEGVKSFVKMFDPARDRLYVVPFNIRGQVFSLKEYTKDLVGLVDLDLITEAQVDAVIESITRESEPQGSTNICDPLMRAVEKLETESLYGSSDVSFVIFSDGAPTAGRWHFNNPKAALTAWNRGKPGAVHDYSAYTVEWRARRDAVSYFGPSILVQSDLLTTSFTGPQPPDPGTGVDDEGRVSPAGWANCSVWTPQAALRPVSSTNNLQGVATSTFSPCLNDFSAKIPQSGLVYGTEYRNGGPKTFADWREQYFNCAIAITDQIRADRGTVYTIGLGEPAGFPNYPGLQTKDPYQNVQDVSSRHDVFNTRLAGDIITAVDIQQTPHPEFNFSGYQSFNSIQSYGRPGVYLATPDPADLEVLFQEIAQKILIRLTE